MVQAPAKPITLEAFLELPETKPASEYIDGYIRQKSRPQAKHSTMQRDLTMAVEMALKPQRIGRAFPELRCTFGRRSDEQTIFVYDENLSLQVFDMEAPNESLPVPVFATELSLTMQEVVNWLLE